MSCETKKDCTIYSCAGDFYRETYDDDYIFRPPASPSNAPLRRPTYEICAKPTQSVVCGMESSQAARTIRTRVKTLIFRGTQTSKGQRVMIFHRAPGNMRVVGPLRLGAPKASAIAPSKRLPYLFSQVQPYHAVPTRMDDALRCATAPSCNSRTMSWHNVLFHL